MSFCCHGNWFCGRNPLVSDKKPCFFYCHYVVMATGSVAETHRELWVFTSTCSKCHSLANPYKWGTMVVSVVPYLDTKWCAMASRLFQNCSSMQKMRFCPSPESTRLWLDYDKNRLKNRLNCDKTQVNLRSWSEHACRSQNSCSHCCAAAQYQNCYFRAINDGIATFRPIILVYTRYLALAFTQAHQSVSHQVTQTLQLVCSFKGQKVTVATIV